MNERERLIDLLNDIQRCGEDYTEYERYGINYPDTVSNENVADYLLSQGVTVKRWIPVTERLPEGNGIYLTFNKNKQYAFHLLQTGKRMWQGIWEEDGITHWMPLPEPPKEE